MNTEPLVSVVLAVYNGERHVSEAIASVLAQSHIDFELIIVDDACTDTTPTIIKQYLSDPRIRCLRNTVNLGLAKSLNIGIREASGKYIARLDADDIAEPDRLRLQVEYLQNNYPTVLVGGWAKHIDADGNELSVQKLPSDDSKLRWLMLFMCPFYHSAVMFNRSVVVNGVGLYNDQLAYSMDYEYWFRIASRYSVANISAVLIAYRETNDSMTGNLKTAYTEGYWIRFGIVSDLLGWGWDNANRNQGTYDIMCKLVVDPLGIKGVNLRDYLFSVKSIMCLRKQYDQYYRVGRLLGNTNNVDGSFDRSALSSGIHHPSGLKLYVFNILLYARLYIKMLVSNSN